MDVGLLVARLMLGPALGAHGVQKLFGRFGGHGLLGTAGCFPPGALFALVTLAFRRSGPVPARTSA